MYCCFFRRNYYPTPKGHEIGGTIYIKEHISCWNINCLFTHNSFSGSGAISLEYHASVKNINCTLMYNYGRMGAVLAQYDINVTNIGSRFISNSGTFGGSLYMRFGGISINTDCLFYNNSVAFAGGAMCLLVGINCSSVNCKFTMNRGERKLRNY